MTEGSATKRRRGSVLQILALGIAVTVGVSYFLGGVIRRFIRESLMQRVTSTHYQILCPPGALTQAAMSEFARRREPLFALVDKKLEDVDSNVEIRVIFDPLFPGARHAPIQEPYSVMGTTVRTKLNGPIPQLNFTADAEAMLHAAWGRPGNEQIDQWTAAWLVGDWHGAEIGMAAAQVEQRLGHIKVASLLAEPPNKIPSPDDLALLGAAWVSEVAELGGSGEVRKLYAAKMSHPNIAEIAKVLGTAPPELERKWQMWMYAYLAGMPAMPRDAAMPMDMPAGGH